MSVPRGFLNFNVVIQNFVLNFARIHAGFLSFAFCNYLASIPCLSTVFWILRFMSAFLCIPFLYRIYLHSQARIFSILYFCCLVSIKSHHENEATWNPGLSDPLRKVGNWFVNSSDRLTESIGHWAEILKMAKDEFARLGGINTRACWTKVFVQSHQWKTQSTVSWYVIFLFIHIESVWIDFLSLFCDCQLFVLTENKFRS